MPENSYTLPDLLGPVYIGRQGRISTRATAIRSLSLNRLFYDQFAAHSEKALKTGVRGAVVEGCTYGVANGLIYLAEALLFYVGAVLIAKERYSYLQMVETLNLVVFSVTIGSQLMAFSEFFSHSFL